MLIVHCYQAPVSLFAPPHRRRPVLPLASNGLNRLARCQGEGAFCGSVANLPGKTQTICSERGLSGDEGVNTGVWPPRAVRPGRAHAIAESNGGAHAQPRPPADELQFKLQLQSRSMMETLLSRGRRHCQLCFVVN